MYAALVQGRMLCYLMFQFSNSAILLNICRTLALCRGFSSLFLRRLDKKMEIRGSLCAIYAKESQEMGKRVQGVDFGVKWGNLRYLRPFRPFLQI